MLNRRAAVLLGLLVQAGVIVLMGPVILALSGTAAVTWTSALASFKFTGPLGLVVFGGQALLRWSDITGEVEQ